jgi:RNA polymerase sigma-70 factor, ECF subfamily
MLIRQLRDTLMPPAELERLYDAHAAALCHYFTGFTRSEADARDLLQEFFIKLARDTCQRPVCNERAYLMRSAHHLAVDWYRRACAGRRATDALACETVAFFAPQVDPDHAEMTLRLEQALLSLPEEQRSVAQLKLWCGLTFEEIAAVQGIPLNTAASRYRYAIDKLRAQLRPLYEELK